MTYSFCYISYFVRMSNNIICNNYIKFSKFFLYFFGKIKVNVTLDFRAIDVKIFTETLGAAAIFKDHENTLQQIMEQNGMKLASFTVGAQNGNDQQRQFANQNRDRTIGKATGRGNKVINTPNTSENSNGEPTGLNLIA